jgi:glycosyltransferase involved in cell wall biosynthesis
VNLTGFLDGELGLGEVARKLGRGLERAEIPFAAIPYRRTPSRQEHPLELQTWQEAPFDTNVICLNADYLHAFLADVGVDFFTGRYSIGVWFWESSSFRPEDLDGFRFLDEVWVASEYVRQAVSAKADISVFVAPLPVEEPPKPTHSRQDLGLAEGFMFLFLFDFVSGQRKNPTAVVEAFKRAFAPGDGPALVMKSINGRERKPQLLDELIAAAEGRPDIHVVDAYVPVDEKDSYMAACDCYVSLHRSEGFGLTMAEAMAHAKPVIATGYSGNLEFMTERNSYLVPYHLTPVPAHWWAYSPGAEWAEPDIQAAASLMQRVYRDHDESRARGARAREDILRRFSLHRTANFITGRLREASAIHALAAASGHEKARRAILEASQELAKGVGGSLSKAAGRRGPTPLLRRLLARLLWPHLEEQHRADSAVLDAVARLERTAIAERQGRLESVSHLGQGQARPLGERCEPGRESPGLDGDR